MRKQILYVICAAALLAAGCEKPAGYNQPLGLFSEYNKLGSAGGVTDVPVFSNTDWTVAPDREASWFSIDRFKGHGCDRVMFNYEVNYGRARRVILVFTATGGETRSINMYQEAGIADSDVVLKFESSTLLPVGAGETLELPFKTNLIYNLDELYLTITYPEGQEPDADWITLDSVTAEKAVLTIAPNTTDGPRTANVRMSHTDAGALKAEEGDTVHSNVLSVVQIKQ